MSMERQLGQNRSWELYPDRVEFRYDNDIAYLRYDELEELIAHYKKIVRYI